MRLVARLAAIAMVAFGLLLSACVGSSCACVHGTGHEPSRKPIHKHVEKHLRVR